MGALDGRPPVILFGEGWKALPEGGGGSSPDPNIGKAFPGGNAIVGLATWTSSNALEG